jgi:actin-related protein
LDSLELAAAALIPYGTLFSQQALSPPECMIVVDSGFSFTHVVPIMEGQVVWHAVKRQVFRTPAQLTYSNLYNKR